MVKKRQEVPFVGGLMCLYLQMRPLSSLLSPLPVTPYTQPFRAAHIRPGAAKAEQAPGATIPKSPTAQALGQAGRALAGGWGRLSKIPCVLTLSPSGGSGAGMEAP